MTPARPRVAILVEDLYQDQEVWYPFYRLREAGIEAVFVGTGKPEYKSKFGYPLAPHAQAGRVSAGEFDAVIIPGGYAPDLLRRVPAVVRLVREANRQGKLLGAICHAGWVLCSADVLRGRTVTCFSAIKDDLVNAGAAYVDREVVRDGNLITSRKPDDLPAFMRVFLQALAQRPGAKPQGTDRQPTHAPPLGVSNSSWGAGSCRTPGHLGRGGSEPTGERRKGNPSGSPPRVDGRAAASRPAGAARHRRKPARRDAHAPSRAASR